MTDKTTETLKLAAKALSGDYAVHPDEALAAIREALAEPVKQEPVDDIQWDASAPIVMNPVAWVGEFAEPTESLPVGTELYAAPLQPVKQEPVACPNLQPVINWLENGCDPKEAAKELRIYQEQMKAAPVSAPKQEKQEPVAVISKSAIGLVKLHSNGDCLPFGTQLYAAPVSVEAIRAEALEEAAKECDTWATVKPFSDFSSGSAEGARNCAAAIRGLK